MNTRESIQAKILDRLKEIREFEWTHDDSLKIDCRYIKEGEPLLEAIARNLTEAVMNERQGPFCSICGLPYEKVGHHPECLWQAKPHWYECEECKHRIVVDLIPRTEAHDSTCPMCGKKALKQKEEYIRC